MACGCGKKAADPTFVYVDAQGRTSAATTNVQALAMKARAGGKGEVKPA